MITRNTGLSLHDSYKQFKKGLDYDNGFFFCPKRPNLIATYL